MTRANRGSVPGWRLTWMGVGFAHGGLAHALFFTPLLPLAMSLIDTTQLALEGAMRGAWARQTLLTNNISNANTPGYRREDLNFQGALRSALAGGESPAQVQFQPEVSSQVVGPEGNGVDIDQESALLAENGLEYQAMVQVMGTRNDILRSAMGVS
jgi:flagellar basal-body rod protein FlgB